MPTFILSYAKIMQARGEESSLSISRAQLILCKDNASERNENLFSNCRAQLILCKDNASERNENLFSNCRAQLILCKDKELMRQMQPYIYKISCNRLQEYHHTRPRIHTTKGGNRKTVAAPCPLTAYPCKGQTATKHGNSLINLPKD